MPHLAVTARQRALDARSKSSVNFQLWCCCLVGNMHIFSFLLHGVLQPNQYSVYYSGPYLTMHRAWHTGVVYSFFS